MLVTAVVSGELNSPAPYGTTVELYLAGSSFVIPVVGVFCSSRVFRVWAQFVLLHPIRRSERQRNDMRLGRPKCP